MEKHSLKYRRSLRLKDYDYSSAGAYFVTICTQYKQCLFGEVNNGQVILNEIGLMLQLAWNDLPQRFPSIELDEFVTMPNHIHGIIVISDKPNVNCRGGVSPPLGEGTSPLQKPALGKIIAFFKYQTTKQINQIHRTPAHRIWQRNYYEHIIRSEKSLAKIREYIINNPLQWELDSENILADANQRKRGKESEKQFWQELKRN